MEQEELIKKYGIGIEKLKKEQMELAKKLEIKDARDFSGITKIGAIDTGFFENKILAGIVVFENEEVIEEKYFSDRQVFELIVN